MSRKIHFELVSPEEKLVSEDVRMAVMPGDAGYFGVMGGHASLLASLGNGVVKLYKEDGDSNPRRIFIAGGFADVTPDLCMILAEEAIDTTQLNSDELTQSLKDLEEDLGLCVETADRTRVREKIVLTKAKLAAISP